MISISGAPGPEVTSLISGGFEPANSNLISGSSERRNAHISPPYTMTYEQAQRVIFTANQRTLLEQGPLPVNIQYAMWGRDNSGLVIYWRLYPFFVRKVNTAPIRCCYHCFIYNHGINLERLVRPLNSCQQPANPLQLRSQASPIRPPHQHQTGSIFEVYGMLQ